MGLVVNIRALEEFFSKLPVSKKQQTVRKAILSAALGRSQIISFEFPRSRLNLFSTVLEGSGW